MRSEEERNRKKKVYDNQYCINHKKEKREYDKQYRAKNKEKLKESKKKYVAKNKERNIIYRQNYKERRKTLDRLRAVNKCNSTLEEYNKLFNEQNGCCAICNIHQDKLKRVLCVDHNHQTNKIRGLLCCKCNRGIGYLNDDIEILQQAVNYLNHFL